MEKPVTGYLDRKSAEKIAVLLRSGGIAVLPTDTVYGFHCAASRIASVEKILDIKGEEKRGKGFILLACDLAMVDTLVSSWPADAREILSKAWPAPLTAILAASKRVGSLLTGDRTIAVRVPDLSELRMIIEMVGEPIISTSANKSGRKTATRIRDIQRAFPGLAAYMSRRGRGSALPSTVVDFSMSPPDLIRAGRYAWPPRKGNS